MLATRQWEEKSSIRNRPHRILAAQEYAYFFPAVEQPLCLHPRIIDLGEDVKRYILIQSAYTFMKTIFINETEVINNISNKIISGKSLIEFPFEINQNLLTVLIDESYHAYVANDFILQVSSQTGIRPLKTALDSSLSRALSEVRKSLPKPHRIVFEIIAACIAENSITKELISISKDPEVNPLFYEINNDHIVDEGRHCRIFSKILTYLWQAISDDAKNSVGSILPTFIRKYLSRDITLSNDREILLRLPLRSDEIETILYDTHPEYSDETLPLLNPIIKNITTLLKNSGVLNHAPTADEFKRLMNINYEALPIKSPLARQSSSKVCNEKYIQAKAHWSLLSQKINTWHLSFLASKKDRACGEVEAQEIVVDQSVNNLDYCGLFMSYLHDIIQNNELSFMLKSGESSSNNKFLPIISLAHKTSSVSEFTEHLSAEVSIATEFASFYEDTIKYKIPLRINICSDFCYDKNYSNNLQVHIHNAKFKIYYQLSFYDKKQISELLENFSYYVSIAQKNGARTRNTLPLVSPKQRRRLLSLSPQNFTTPKYSVLSLFQEQVSAIPNKLAIIDKDQEISYEELDKLSNIVAFNLEKRGLNRASIVAVVHKHGYEYIPLIIGIMKAGMVFMPLAHDGPVARLRKILKESEADLIIISDENQAALLGAGFSWITAKQMLESKINITPMLMQRLPRDLAYIIYTSGSTGEPKGVMISDLALCNLAQSVARTFPISQGDRVLQFSPYCFDPSLAEITGALITGATLVIRSENMLDSSIHFFSECQRLGVTLLNLPTSLWSQLSHDLESCPHLLPSSLKTLVIGGEAVQPHELKRWYKLVREPIKLLNTYGPTETTIAITACNLDNYPVLRNSESLIGTSFANAKLYVLDEFLRLLPVGVVGELYVSGPGVSEGYFKDPDFSSKRFLELSGIGPIYKTGDRVKWLESLDQASPHLLLAFFGRVDKQIKVRGFRIELGEIEEIIKSYEGVSSCHVLHHQKNNQDYLAAFIIPEHQACISVEKLSAMTQSLLPEYMQPKRFLLIEKWPVNAQGKIDEEKLRDLLNAPAKSSSFNTSIEEGLANIWKNLLTTQDISFDSHFFHLGGHSLLALRLLSLVNQEFHTKLTLRNILETPRFSQMVALIKEDGAQKSLMPCASPLHAPLSFSQEALWVLDQLQNGQSINYNIAYALHFKNSSSLDFRALEKSLNYILQRHEILRSVFQKSNNIPMQVVVEKSLELKLEFASIEEFNIIAKSDARTAFDLAKEPPLRIRLFCIDHDYHILFINHHHIIHDGHSIDIFLKELQVCYKAFFGGQTPSLINSKTQYADYAQQQRNDADGLWKDSLSYWCKKLKNYTPLQLPSRKSNAKINQAHGERYRLSIKSRSVDALRMLCEQEDCTLFVGLLAIFQILLHRDCRSNDVAIASMISTREYENDAHIIGMFLNTIIFRQQILPTQTFKSYLKCVKETFFEAAAHRLVPLQKILQTTKINRLPNDNSLFDIMIIFHHREQNFSEANFDALKANIEFIDNKTSKFGLSLDIFEFEKTLDIEIEYSPELYSSSAISNIAQRYANLIDIIACDNQLDYRSISDIVF